jgi:hypothetical protein
MHHRQQNCFLREMNSPGQGKGTTIWREGSSWSWEDIGRFDDIANTFGRAYSPDTDAHEARKRWHSITSKMICEHQGISTWSGVESWPRKSGGIKMFYQLSGRANMPLTKTGNECSRLDAVSGGVAKDNYTLNST